MNYDKTDKIISEKYLSVTPDFDAESAWGELEGKIKSKRKRRPILWYISGLSIFILLVFIQSFVTEVATESDRAEAAKSQSLMATVETVDESSEEVKKANDKMKSDKASDFGKSTKVDFNSESGIKRNAELSGKIYKSPLEETNSKNGTKSSDNQFDVPSNQEQDVASAQSKIKDEERQLSPLDLLYGKLKPLSHITPLVAPVDLSFVPINNSKSDKGKIRLGFNGGYYLYSRSFEFSGTGSIDTYNSRTDEENALDAFDLGLKLDYFISDKFVVFGGLRFDHSYVERKADYIYLESITIPDHTVVIIETDEGTIEQTESITYDGYYNHKSNNYVTSKRIGALVGLQYRIGKGRWKSHLNLGIEMPIWTKLSGVITNEGKPYDLSDGSLDINRNRLLLFGGVGAEYALMDEVVDLQIIIGGYLPTGNEYKESYNIIKKSTQLGVNFGLHFHL